MGIRSATPFDPPELGGDGKENGALAPLAIDGKADTGWRTEGYNDRDITKLKDGVGLILQLSATATLEELQLDSPTNGWRIAVYVADSVPSSLAGWGAPVTTTGGLKTGTSKIDLHGRRGDAVLVWILDRGDAPGRTGALIDEARVTAR
jgi:hypothetical protein